MISCSLRRGTAAIQAPKLQLLFLALSVAAAGCSVERLPLDPAAGPSRPGPVVSATLAKDDAVVVTVVDGSDPVAIAEDYDATIVLQGWKVAAYQPASGQTGTDLLNALLADPRVQSVERNTPVETAETRQESFAFDNGWGSPLLCAEQPAALYVGLAGAHAVSRGAGVLVAVLDTGIERDHPIFAGRIAGGWDFVDEDSDPSESGDGLDNDGDGWVDEALGHGTHVSGIVTTTAPEAGLLIGRVLDGEGRGDMLGVARAIRWAVQSGARVINLSLGGLQKSETVRIALQEADAAGVVCVGAAGNWGALEPEEYPASSREVIAVAALGDGDVLAPFSSYGGFVEICAPGAGIRSAYPGGLYASWSGTSMAAPFVSGGTALLLAVHPDWNLRKTLERLSLTARSLDNANGSLSGYLGAGAIRLDQALIEPVAQILDD